MIVTDLSDLQCWMAELLRRRHALTKDHTVVERAKACFTGNDRLLPVEQIEIYREQFWLRHTSSLVEDFPGLGGILGQSDWERLVEEYLEAYAPDSWTLRDLGHHMPEHVETSTWLPHHPLCIDMARLEWTYIELFDARDTTPLDPEKLASIPDEAWETAVIVVSPSLRLLRTEHPVAELRKRLRDGDRQVPIPSADPQNLVLYRDRSLSLSYEVVGDGAFELLRALVEGVPLVAACERAVERVPADAKGIEVSVGQWFQEWARRAWVVDVET